MCVYALTLQKLQQVAASSEEERKRLEVAFKERIAAYDDKLREVCDGLGDGS